MAVPRRRGPWRSVMITTNSITKPGATNSVASINSIPSQRATNSEPHTNAATTEVPIGHPVALTAGDKAVWVSDSRGRVWRIDSETAAVTQTIPVGRGLIGLCATAAAVWAVINADGTVARIDPENGEVVGRVAVGHSPTDVATWEGAVWVSTQGESAN